MNKTYKKNKTYNQKIKNSTHPIWHKRLWQMVFVTVSLFLLGFAFRQLILTAYLVHPVSGSSMEPTLKEGEKVVISKRAEIQRYDLISFSMAEEDDQFVKRIIGLPNDAIFVTGTRLVFDLDGTGKFLNTYSVDISETWAREWRGLTEVPKDCYFVLGDHLGVSKDSRVFGWVEAKTIEGTVVLQY
ncbi:signal peptidase I [Enterococcus sp. JM4C]|uniref:signal peptidase I n=1 Tax=Candidatus Enterococcus huntleyi TaxID=1857217 RepID=UPI00137B11AD|nr:signal peptidase I [Enterococcus sp. JM4C]KAF1295848.1 signal peptidase I [Enterococcus sp. JM4C]